MKYWINVVSKDHVMRGVAGGFTQANHGKPQGLKRLRKGDWIVFYSPKVAFQGKESLQCFTAIGQVSDDEVYQYEMSEDFKPFRRHVEFKDCTEVSILPLIEQLSFIKDKQHWGFMFRFGFFEIPEKDFTIISQQMFAQKNGQA
jgi:hypothetical protein